MSASSGTERTRNDRSRSSKDDVRAVRSGAHAPVGDEVVAVGWYPDPFGRHEIRWFSQGEPTSMVRDGMVESHDWLDI